MYFSPGAWRFAASGRFCVAPSCIFFWVKGLPMQETSSCNLSCCAVQCYYLQVGLWILLSILDRLEWCRDVVMLLRSEMRGLCERSLVWFCCDHAARPVEGVSPEWSLGSLESKQSQKLWRMPKGYIVITEALGKHLESCCFFSLFATNKHLQKLQSSDFRAKKIYKHLLPPITE